MEPQIRYALTSDGVSIAHYAIGDGPVLVWAALPFSHVQAELRDPETRRTYEAVARLATLVRYDHRGFGLSDRTVTSFTLDALTSDLEAVVDRLHLERFILYSAGSASPMALRYAALHPSRVTHLVLYPGFARVQGIGWKHWEALAAMATDDWTYVSEAMLRAAFGWDNEEDSRRDAELLRNAISPEALVDYLHDAKEWDASAFAAQVTAPTLLLQLTGSRYTTMDATRQLAAELPDSRLVMIDGLTVPERSVQAFAAVANFVGVDPAAALASRAPGQAGTAIVLFTDIVESTTLTERMGDAAFRAASRALEERIRSAMRDAGGTTVPGKVLGDGVMAIFTSATRAIQAAQRCLDVSDELPIHIGMHAGDVIHEDGNVYGGTVNIASRICALCEPGEILVSATVRDLARTSAGVTFEDRGEHALKGITDPVRVFAVREGAG